MEYHKEQLAAEIQNADMVLVGIGEEFEQKKFLNTLPQYKENLEKMKAVEKEFLIPVLDYYYLKKQREELFEAYRELGRMLQDKNYFIVSTVMNEIIYDCGCFDRTKIVTPCGGYRKLQCLNGCGESLIEWKEEYLEAAAACCEGKSSWKEFWLGSCPQCSGSLACNNVYLEQYLEAGYLPDWERYMKWTQGTLNRRVLILELGVGLNYPNIIRWPFEKIAYFNQKASFFRIHETLYQMTEELQKKGISIPRNAVSFLGEQV